MNNSVYDTPILLTIDTPYAVEMGVHGATRTSTRKCAHLGEAEARALRWSRSNSQGHYWAEITKNGKLVSRFNLA